MNATSATLADDARIEINWRENGVIACLWTAVPAAARLLMFLSAAVFPWQRAQLSTAFYILCITGAPAVWLLIVVVTLKSSGRFARYTFRLMAFTVVGPALAVGLWRTDAAFAYAFSCAKPAFERLAVSGSGTGQCLQCGVFWIVEYRTDPRGGVYFRAGENSVCLDVNSHGFAYRPNAKGTPFGDAHYEWTKLDEDWYYFRAVYD